MQDYVAGAKEIIKGNIYCAISTASTDGKPWISPVFFAYDDNYNIYWVSNKDSRHSKLIRSNPQVAIAIFNSQVPEGEGDAVYFEANVIELTDEKDIKAAMEIMDKRVTKDEFRVKRLEDVTKEGIWRIYKAVPSSVSKLTEGEFINGQYVDKRVDIELSA